MYIGSSIDYDRRIKTHFRELRNNKHSNSHLQRAFNKYGEDNFEVFKLLNSTKGRLIEDEQWCLDINKPQYNICKIAGNTLGLKWNEERRIKQMKYLSNKSQTHIDNLSKSLKSNKEFIKICTNRCYQMSKNNKKCIEVLDLENNLLFEFESIIETSQKLNINKNNIQSRLNNIVKSPYQNKYKFKYKE